MKKTSGTWKIDDDIVRQFDELANSQRVPKGEGVQLGIWLVCQLTPEQRMRLFAEMDARTPIRLTITKDRAGMSREEILSDLSDFVKDLKDNYPEISAALADKDGAEK